MKNIKQIAENLPSQILELENSQLKKQIEGLNTTIDNLLKELDNARNIDRDNVIKLIVSQEEQICIEQITRLKSISQERMLSLEESKMLDLHIKNKRLLDNKPTINANFKEIPDGMSQKDLLKLAGTTNVEKKKR